MTPPAYHIRRATVADAATLGAHRAAMFREIGRVRTDAAMVLLQETATPAIAAVMSSEIYLGWLAEVSEDTAETGSAYGSVLGSAAVYLQQTLPRPSADGLGVATGPTPLVVDVYTDPMWRRHGIARQLMHAVLAWADETGVDRVRLHAADAARPLYEQLGFRATNEMLWTPPDRDTSSKDR